MWNLAEDTISNADIDALADWLRGYPRLTEGKLVHEFERAWSEWLGVRESVMVTSGTSANFAVVAAAASLVPRARPRIAVAAVTWSTNVSPSLLLGHEVMVLDVDPRTLGIDEQRAVAAMDRGHLDILFITHLLGLNALSQPIIDAAERNGVILLEDCCESHGTQFGAKKVGTFGLGSTFSFFFGHHMSTIEGGMVSTNDPEFADRIRLMRGHGLARVSAHYNQLATDHPGIDPRFLFVTAGLNFRSTELNAFLGLRQLKVLDERISIRNTNFDRFLDTAPQYLRTDFRREGASSFALPLIARDAASSEWVRACVDDLGIESRPVVAGNLLRQPFLQGYPVESGNGDTMVADGVHDYGLYVGNGHHVTPSMVDTLTTRLAQFGKENYD